MFNQSDFKPHVAGTGFSTSATAFQPQSTALLAAARAGLNTPVYAHQSASSSGGYGNTGNAGNIDIFTNQLDFVDVIDVVDPIIVSPLFPLDDNSMANARSLGSLNGNTVTRYGFVGDTDTVDYYKFSFSGFGSTRSFNLSLTGLTGDADVYLLNSDGVQIASSTRGGSNDESINLKALSIGTLAVEEYFIRVQRYGGDNTNYTLQVSDSRPSNLLPTEVNLGNLTGVRTRTGFVGSQDTADVFQFSIGSIKEVTLTLTGMSADADLRLIQDFNGNGIVDSGDVLVSSSRGGTLNETMSKVLLAGNYFAQVVEYGGDTNYTLRISEANPVVKVNLANVFAIDDPDDTFGDIFNWDQADFYSRITIDGSTHTTGVISNNNNISPNWTYSRSVSDRYISISIQLFDSDNSIFGDSSQRIDIDPGSGLRDVNITYDVFTNSITGDVFGSGGSLLSSTGGGGDGARARVDFRVETSDWYATNLGDFHLTNLTRSFARDGVLSRTDMMTLMRESQDAGSVSSTELTDLRTVLSSLGYMMPDSVRVLSNKVLNTNVANTRSGIGNLFAGSTANHMERLIGKWFLGNDRPIADAGTTYQSVSGSLFRGGVSYLDVDQGGVGDCYLLCSLGAVALHNPSQITSMITDNGDDTFTVRFFNNGVADYVTVDRFLPTWSNGTAVYAGWSGASVTPSHFSDTTNELWAALIEKAYAQINEEGWIGQDNTNTYQGIAGGWNEITTEQITGQAADSHGMTTNFLWWRISDSADEMVAAFNAGRPVSLSTPGSPGDGIVGNHCYTLIGYNAATDQFRVFNPWNYNNDAQAERWITRNQLLNNFDGWVATA